MSRPLRLDYPGAHFHVSSGGNAKRQIFEDDADRERFLRLLCSSFERYAIVCHAYCLMGNHYHLLAESLDGRISQAMQHLNGRYAASFNRRWSRRGHLFHGRFFANLIDRDSHFLVVVRYVELNPCRAHFVTDPADWPWSSYPVRLGRSPRPPFLETGAVLRHFGRGAQALHRYSRFILAGIGDDTIREELRNNLILGSESFVEEHAARARMAQRRQAIPLRQRKADRPKLATLLGSARGEKLRATVAKAFLQHGYKMTEIAEALGLHYTTISRWLQDSPESSGPRRSTIRRRLCEVDGDGVGE